MHCPFCRHCDSRVIDSRVTEDGASIRRRRQCPACDRRFTTIEQTQLIVVKRSGVKEPFSRDKVIAGVRKACKGRPVSETQLARLGQRVEEALRASGQAEVPTEEVGVAILGPLSELDPVAYLRFASVYKHYDSVDDFLDEIAQMQAGPRTVEQPTVEQLADPPSGQPPREGPASTQQPLDEQDCQPALVP